MTLDSRPAAPCILVCCVPDIVPDDIVAANICSGVGVRLRGIVLDAISRREKFHLWTSLRDRQKVRRQRGRSEELLATGIFGSGSRLAERIETLVQRRRVSVGGLSIGHVIEATPKAGNIFFAF